MYEESRIQFEKDYNELCRNIKELQEMENRMTGKEYQEFAMRTYDGCATLRLLTSGFDNEIDTGGLLNGCLGLAGESGESLDLIKKWIFHEKPLDKDHFKKEIGDVMWYVALICESMRWDLDEILQMNVDKLRARYPEGFDIERANNRKEGDI